MEQKAASKVDAPKTESKVEPSPKAVNKTEPTTSEPKVESKKGGFVIIPEPN